LGLQAEQGLEGGHRGAAAVEAEGELVEVDRQMIGGHTTERPKGAKQATASRRPPDFDLRL